MVISASSFPVSLNLVETCIFPTPPLEVFSSDGCLILSSSDEVQSDEEVRSDEEVWSDEEVRSSVEVRSDFTSKSRVLHTHTKIQLKSLHTRKKMNCITF